MKEEILKALESIRPFLQADNGDVELVEVTEEGIVKVRLTGDCENCPMSTLTLTCWYRKSFDESGAGYKKN